MRGRIPTCITVCTFVTDREQGWTTRNHVRRLIPKHPLSLVLVDETILKQEELLWIAAFWISRFCRRFGNWASNRCRWFPALMPTHCSWLPHLIVSLHAPQKACYRHNENLLAWVAFLLCVLPSFAIYLRSIGALAWLAHFLGVLGIG